MKRKLTALLAALMAVSTLLASCSDAENGGSTETQSPTVTTAAETAAETEEPKILPDLPEINFEGADFRIYNWDFPDRRVWDEIYSEEENGEPINDMLLSLIGLISVVGLGLISNNIKVLLLCVLLQLILITKVKFLTF